MRILAALVSLISLCLAPYACASTDIGVIAADDHSDAGGHDASTDAPPLLDVVADAPSRTDKPCLQ
jgi:hypothetical protein